MSGLSGIGSISSAQLFAVQRIQELGNAITQNNERLATLKRINSAADDPSGLIQAELLRTELTAAEEAASNVTRASSMLSTADSTAGEILTNLNEARTLTLEAAGGTLTSSEITANQIQVDTILRGIDTLAQTEFTGRRLLDGSSAFRVSGADSTEVLDVDVLDKQTEDDVTVSMKITTQATQASDSYTSGTLGADATLLVTGIDGSTTISLTSGDTTQDIADAFNAASYLTGITATRVDANQVDFTSTDYGSDAIIQIEAVSGTFNTSSGGSTQGIDAIATINGQSVTAGGTTFSYHGSDASLEIEVDPSASGTLTSFVVSGEGLEFNIGTTATATARIGLPALTTASLGGIDGKLHSIMSGGANTLTGGNSATALRIVDDAIADVTRAQASIGAFESYTLDSSSRVLASTIENTTTALSDLEDADVALETALLTNNQLMQQTAYQALAISALQSESILSILSAASQRS